MAYNFPDSPSNGDTVTINGIVYTYNSTKGAWKTTAGSGGGGGGASVTVSETAPTSPSEGDLWFDPSVLKTFVYYDDGTANQWVQSNPTGSGGGASGGASVTVSETAPTSPSAGDVWWSSSEAVMYIYYTDTDSSQWVSTSVPGADGADGATGSVSVTTADTAPSNPSDGELWWNTDANKLYIYYADTDSSQWVQATTPGAAGANGTDGATPGRNKIINGNFDVWQYGTSFTASGFTADRWHLTNIGTSSTFTQQVFTLGQTDVPDNPANYVRGVVSSVTGAGNTSVLKQKIENVRTFQGQTVTLSFYAKADAVKNIAVDLYQNFGTSGSPSTSVYITPQKFALSTTWTKYTKTFTIPSITGKTLGTDNNDFLQLSFWLDAGSDFNSRTDTLGHQSGTFEFAQVQLESGSSATDFEHKSIGETIQDCKRYYIKDLKIGGGGYATGSGQTARAMTSCTFPVEMRASPTVNVTIGQSGSISSVQANSLTSHSCQFGGTSSASGSIWYKASATLDAEL